MCALYTVLPALFWSTKPICINPLTAAFKITPNTFFGKQQCWKHFFSFSVISIQINLKSQPSENIGSAELCSKLPISRNNQNILGKCFDFRNVFGNESSALSNLWGSIRLIRWSSFPLFKTFMTPPNFASRLPQAISYIGLQQLWAMKSV